MVERRLGDDRWVILERLGGLEIQLGDKEEIPRVMGMDK